MTLSVHLFFATDFRSSGLGMKTQHHVTRYKIKVLPLKNVTFPGLTWIPARLHSRQPANYLYLAGNVKLKKRWA